jgi:hypothetical protein
MFDLAFIFNDFISINCTGWCEMKNLKQLDLSENDLGGSLPDCLGNLSSLQLLDVSENQFGWANTNLRVQFFYLRISLSR